MEKFTRRDIGYSIISRFEKKLRDFISSILPLYFSNYEDGIPIGILNKTKDRASRYNCDDLDDFLENTDFMDLSEIICFKDMYNNYLGEHVFTKIDFNKIMQELYNLRCKIAHISGYFTSLDLDNLIDNSRKISSYLNKFGEEFTDFIKNLQKYPESYIVQTPIDFLCDVIGVPNNLPTPDYDFEGGFVGRKEDTAKIISLIESNLHRVVTITGAGGVGKTALALKVVYDLIAKSTKKYDGIIWISAKETKLSYLGIEDVEPSIKNYEELLDTICDVMGYGSIENSTEQKEIDVKTIFEWNKCILIVIDNLETITDNRIINFILDSDPKINILITSRKGLGQVERRYELKQLKEKEAVIFFRLIARDKRLDALAKLDDEIVKRYVNKLSCYPLAIKWVIGVSFPVK